ncbi:hypothetical protein GCM10010994_44590 [Chelatococcus reniformis]|uniref:Uncharacterized protein n=1 Tax=Chelatococcus reniformis TaxID=1494448 RepID=A0A916XLL8_9HYPH|nr:hypothetical protein GCM10010994_44590 [Chelatococcus reniformis]
MRDIAMVNPIVASTDAFRAIIEAQIERQLEIIADIRARNRDPTHALAILQDLETDRMQLAGALINSREAHGGASIPTASAAIAQDFVTDPPSAQSASARARQRQRRRAKLHSASRPGCARLA